MKKIVLLMLFFLPFLVKATTYTSTTTGNWTSAATWGGGGYPGIGDVAIISASTTVTLTANQSVFNVSISSGGTLAGSSFTLSVYGNFSNSGTFTGSTGTIAFSGTSAQTITGPVTFNNLTISSSSTVTLVSAITVSTTFLLSSGTFDVSSSNWGLTITDNFTNNGGTFNPESGTVTFTGTGTLGGTSPTTFYYLTKSTAGTTTLGANVTVSKDFTISAGTFVTSTHSMTISGNFTNSGTFTNSGISSTITFNSSSGNQTIGGTTSTTTFHNIIINTSASTDSIILGDAISISDSLAITSGSLASESHTISGNGTGTFTMATGTNLVLGNSSATGINFPSGFIAAHITLNVNSTVTYQTGGSQTVSFLPTYGNLVISGSGTKSPSSTPMNIAGNLTINSGATLNETVDAINLTGNLSLAGTLSFSSGTLNIGGNFTNNGTFTSGTLGTVVCNGTSGQTIGGAAMTAFHNLTFSTSGSETITMGNNESVSNAFLVSSGTFTLAGSIYTLSIGGAFTSNSSLTATSGTIVMNGAAAETLGGTSSPTFYNFTVNCTSIYTVSMTVAITINNNFSITSGSLNSEINQITGNSTGAMNLSAGTTLLLGLTSSTSYVLFPTNFTSIYLDPASTVTYQAENVLQSIYATPTYGNLTITTGSTPIAKTPTGTPLTIKGSLTIGTNATLTEATYTVNLTGNLLLSGGTITFTTGALNIGGNLTNTGGTYTAGTGTTTFDASGANQTQTVGGSHASNMYNLIINPSYSSDSVLSTDGITVSNNLTISNGTLACRASISGTSGGQLSMAAGTDLAIGIPTNPSAVVFPSNYTNANIILNSTSTVTYAANANQTISATPSYTNLVLLTGATSTSKTISAALSVAGNLTVNSNTTLNSWVYQITGNASGTFSMASGSTLLLGETTSGTNVSFPNSFTSAHISLDPNSTVKYLAETSTQQISVTPTYGNLVISTGSTATKAPTGTPLVIKGYLTVNANVTLNETGSNSITLTGNDTNKGVETFATGTFSIGANFINNGTYNYGTGTTTFNGTGTQTIGGTTTTTFYNLSIASSGTVQPAYNLTINKNLAISSGTLDVTGLNYSVSVAGNFTNTGGTFNPETGTVTMNGGTQTLGGSTTLTLYKLIIYSGSNTTLGGNVTMASDVTINSSATLNGSSYIMSIAGNYTDNGTFNCNTGTITFNANGNQCIADPSGPETFKNVTVYSTSHLGATCTVDLTGLLTILPGGTMACNCN